MDGINSTAHWATAHRNAETITRDDTLLGIIWPDQHAITPGRYVVWTPGTDHVTHVRSRGHATDHVCGGVQASRGTKVRKAKPALTHR